ncbi:MAG: lipocalin family protein [Bacteroidales bacterium]|nr:lipocalin family protein [Bacteroidales bacterium]
MRRLFLIAISILTMIGCSKEPLSLEGTWSLYEVRMYRTQDNFKEPEVQNDRHASLTFNSDGTYIYNSDQGTIVGRWALKKSYLTLKNGKDEIELYVKTPNKKQLVLEYRVYEEHFDPETHGSESVVVHLEEYYYTRVSP